MLNVLFGQLYSEGFYSEQTPTCRVRELTQMAVRSAVLVIGTSGEEYKPNLITLVTIVASTNGSDLITLFNSRQFSSSYLIR